MATFERDALPYVSDLRAAAMRYVRNHGDADDLVQETLLRAYTAWERYQSGTNCRAWLLRILTNSFINEYRRGVRERRFRQGQDPTLHARRANVNANPESVLMEGLIGDEVSAALGALAPSYRQVVTLADLDGLSYKEIARRLNCPMGTVMSRLHRARRQLGDALAAYARERGIVRQAA
ncbi:MAG: sigma-70 family RNA polymerase sigma factor, partial [Deltaproteobacteria bacterium]|nr:sigma-70 family RNA polymerase sigma factor [Deltaproteobacteria bacterium]